MKKFDFVKKFFSFMIMASLCCGFVCAQETEAERKKTAGVVVQGDTEEGKAIEKAYNKDFEFSYWLGGEYTYAFDLPFYSGIGFYSNWQKDMKDISPKMIDNLGSNGHIARVTNTFEWRWPNNFSITAFANITLNYFPALIDTSFAWVPDCWKASMACFKACGSIIKWSVSGPWLIVNVCTAFLLPATAFLVCAFSGGLCLLAIPCSVVLVTGPMFTVGGSIDYHFWNNEIVDTKCSLGLDIDGYRGIMHVGFCGLFVQGEASATFSKLKLYAQAGYRLDVMNILTSVSTNKGNAKAGYESKYVPAPYVKAGLTYRIK